MALSQTLVDDDQHLIRYLLGLLPEEEAEPLDEASIADDEFPARLGSVEDDLIDAYINRKLDPELRMRFEAVYLASPRRRARVDFARRFLAAVTTSTTLPSAPSPIVRPLVAAAMLVLTCGTLLIGYIALRPEAAAPRAVPAPRASSSVAPIAFTLMPQTRGAEQVPTLAISSGADRVTFVLRLNSNDFAVYEASVQDVGTGGSVWKSGAVTASAKDGRPAVSLVIPADVFRQQHYSIELQGLDPHRPAEAIASYAFAVERP